MTTPDYKLIHVENPNTDFLDISELFRSEFDHVVKRINYNHANNPFHIYEHVKKLFNGTDSKITFPTITLACDQAISLATISGLCEAHMNMRSVDGHVIADGDIHLIYIDSMPDIQTIDVENHDQLTEQIVSSAMGIRMSFCEHRVNMSAKNIHYFGLNEDLLSSVDRQSLDDYNLENYSLQLLRKKGIGRILNILLKKLEYERIYIVFDMCSLEQSTAPSTYRYTTPGSENGFTGSEINEIFSILHNHPKIRGIDITGFNFGLRAESTKNITNNQITMSVIENILKIFVDIKKNSINIFNENSKFLIWRKLCDDGEEDPIGWKILKGMSLEERSRIMSSIDDDSVLTIPIVDSETGDSYDALVTTTTVEEQQEKSYYVTNDYLGFCLLPGEKIDMIFELLNTPQNKIAE